MAPQVPKDFRRVIVAAAVGNVIEWYDFYIFGSLAAILSVQFFEQTHPVAALLSTIALFTAGIPDPSVGGIPLRLAGRPRGPQVHLPHYPDRNGTGHGCDRVDPDLPVDRCGLAAVLLFALRMIQGLCLGGEYGGAITYVAEHVSDERRGFYTGWLQTSPTLGIVVSMIVIVGTRATSATRRSTTGGGASRSWFLSCWWRSRSTSACNCRRRRSSRRSGPRAR